MKSNNMIDRIRRRDIGFLPELNTEHDYHCNSLLYMAFVIGEKKKGKKGKQTIVMYLQTKGPTQIKPLIRERQLLVKRETSDNTHYLVLFIVGSPQLTTLRLLSTHRLWVNWQRNLRFIGKSRLILIIKIIDWYYLYCF